MEIGVNAQYTNSIIGNGTPSASNCLKCDSSIDSVECIYQPNYTKMCISNTRNCYIHLSEVNSQKVLRRGCVDPQDPNVNNQLACTNPDICVVCVNGNKCNSKELRKERCINAEYTINSPMITPSESSSVECPTSLDPLGCYHFERSGSVTKGCVSSLTKQLRDEIRSSRDCEICFGNNCNSKLTRIRKCIQCDGTISANCSEIPVQQVSNDFCSSQSDSCLVGIDVNGYTHRICASSQTSDYHLRYPNGFELCQNDSCNANAFPSNRLKCFHCNGDVDNCHTTNTFKRPTACQIYSRNDECYTYFDKGKFHHVFDLQIFILLTLFFFVFISEDGIVFRGCMSDKTESKLACEKGDRKCIKCGSNACNSSGYNLPHFMTIAMVSMAILGGLHI